MYKTSTWMNAISEQPVGLTLLLYNSSVNLEKSELLKTRIVDQSKFITGSTDFEVLTVTCISDFFLTFRPFLAHIIGVMVGII